MVTDHVWSNHYQSLVGIIIHLKFYAMAYTLDDMEHLSFFDLMKDFAPPVLINYASLKQDIAKILICKKCSCKIEITESRA